MGIPKLAWRALSFWFNYPRRRAQHYRARCCLWVCLCGGRKEKFSRFLLQEIQNPRGRQSTPLRQGPLVALQTSSNDTCYLEGSIHLEWRWPKLNKADGGWGVPSLQYWTRWGRNGGHHCALCLASPWPSAACCTPWVLANSSIEQPLYLAGIFWGKYPFP